MIADRGLQLIDTLRACRATFASMPEPVAPTSPHHAIAKRLIDGRTWVSDVALSPDGRRVASVVSVTSLDQNTTTSSVWLDGSPLSSGGRDGQPTWSPDGRSLAFTAARSEKKEATTLHVIPIDGPGETRTVCEMLDGIGDVAWSPDGQWIGFTSRTQDDRYLHDEALQPPRKIDRFFSRLDGEGWIFDRPSHVYVVRADGTAGPRNLTAGPFQHSGIAWLRDSRGLITAAQRHDTWDTDFAEDLYVIPLDADDHPESIRCLTAHDGLYSKPAVSPDGSRVAFVGHSDTATYPQNAGVGVLPIGADTAATAADISWVSAAMDRTFDPIACGRPPIWVDDETLVVAADDRGETHVYQMPADGSGVPQPLTSGALTVRGYDMAAATLATIRSSVDHPPELWLGDERSSTVAEDLAKHSLSWEKFAAPTSDGTDVIDAWIMRPSGFDEAATYPVLLNVHGGPFTQYGEVFFDEAQMQAAAGFVVLMCNPRGGSGRSTAWGQAILGTLHPVAPGSGWGSVDIDDVLAVLDTALDRFDFCDADRVGMLGGSYGGFVATWLAAHHGHRFRGICSERAVNNLLSEEWSSDAATAFRTEHGPSHIDAPEVYTDCSPMVRVKDIDVPMLLIHSENDLRCPIAQAEELFVALRLLGKPVDFYRFPGECHELSRSGSPVHRVQRAEIILDWFTAKLAPR
jgi:dipeptidyl aminopeptidase/acylaminoacyl peptidase